MKKIEKAYEGIMFEEELAMETIEEKEEIVSLEKFDRYSYTRAVKERTLELELEILEIKRGEF